MRWDWSLFQELRPRLIGITPDPSWGAVVLFNSHEFLVFYLLFTVLLFYVIWRVVGRQLALVWLVLARLQRS